MRRILHLLLLSLFVCFNAQSQDTERKTGIGFRFGGMTSGITFRAALKNDAAFEGIVSFGHKSFLITGLYEKMKPIESTEGLKWFYGIGGHIGFFKRGGTYWVYKNKGQHVYYYEDGGSKAVPGIDFIIGMDYTFKNAPFNLSLDIKPFMDFIEGTEIYFDGALSFRFVF
jgi:hypothetical protein